MNFLGLALKKVKLRSIRNLFHDDFHTHLCVAPAIRVAVKAELMT